MARYEILSRAISQSIKENGNNEITGALLQSALLSMINSLGVGYQYMGIATPSFQPGTPDQNVFYFASEAGLYPNFGGVTVEDGEFVVFKWNGTWSKTVIFSVEGGSIVVKEPYFPVVEQTESVVEIAPNTFNRWGEISSLTITLGQPTDDAITNEYIIEFVSGATAPTLILPDGLLYESALEISENKTYQISIVNNMVVWSAFE